MVGGTRIHREIHERALVERGEKILISKKKTSYAAREVEVSLDRADAIIEGGASLRSKGGAQPLSSKSHNLKFARL
jgi:hypothetical protein